MKVAMVFGATLMLMFLLAAAASANTEARWGIGSWHPDPVGNHRAVIRVSDGSDAVRVRIPWRRRDATPGDIAVRIFAASTEREVTNLVRAEINRTYGDIVFQPAGPGDYYAYYLPCSLDKGSWFTAGFSYLKAEDKADPAWVEKHSLSPADLAKGDWRKLAEAELVEIQARTEFDSFYPMEVVASEQETKTMTSRYPMDPYLTFPEDRKNCIRMTADIPLKWAQSGPSRDFWGEVRPNEYYVFQVGIYACWKPVNDIKAEFSDLTSDGGVIPASALTCFELSGIDTKGRAFTKNVSVALAKVQVLWFGVDVPRNIAAGTYSGTIKLSADGCPDVNVRVALTVAGDVLEDRGDSELWRLSRLRWFNSTIAIDDEPTKPYTPLKVIGDRVACLGRDVTFAAGGLPKSIRSGEHEILSAPMGMVVETSKGKVAWRNETPKLVKSNAGEVLRKSTSSGDGFTRTCWSKMEFDGHIDYRVSIKAEKPAKVKDIRVELPIRREIAAYMMGLKQEGGLRKPGNWKWKWPDWGDNNVVWIGDVEAGVCMRLLAADFDIHPYYRGFRDRRLQPWPKEWENGGKGGCDVTEKGDTVLVNAYSGERTLEAGEVITFCFGLTVTPVKPLDQNHWDWRYYHFYQTIVQPEDIAAKGANIINVHQGNDLNRYINYPFLNVEGMRDYVNRAHAKGLRAKFYYTLRELSNHMAEIWAARSLGNEVFRSGTGGGGPWLTQHLDPDYTPAWQTPYADGDVDGSLLTEPYRLANHYLEGLDWLVRNVGIDGIYVDGTAWNRDVAKRIRKIMDRAKPGCLWDYHSGNNYWWDNCLINCVLQQLENLPYMDSLWIGEGFDYNGGGPDWWLIEVSGIPFGLYGEMLGRGNPWRGMIYGMTDRAGWGGNPGEIWKIWDSFGIKDSKMIGYWDKSCPVRTTNKDVLATVYKKQGKSLVSVASWSPGPAKCKLDIDWKALGIDGSRAKITAPEIPSFQSSAEFGPDSEIPIEPKQGWLLIITEG